MRKKICSYCNKVVDNSHECPNKPKRTKTERTIASEKLLRTKRWERKRKQILQRDNYMCQRCWIKYGIINNDNLQVHHIKSRVDYPDLAYTDENLVTVCSHCNWNLEAKHLNHELDFVLNQGDDREFLL